MMKAELEQKVTDERTRYASLEGQLLVSTHTKEWAPVDESQRWSARQ
jgi:hypothetical protein